MTSIKFWVGVILAVLLAAVPLSAQLTGPVVSGTATLDGSNPTPVVTGLRVLTSCTISKVTSSAPGVGASMFTTEFTPTSGAGQILNIYAWAPTSTSVTTLVASTSREVVAWICTGRN